MQYVNYNYYINDYLLGKSPVVPEEVFPYYEKQARSEVDRYTFNRLLAHPSLISNKVQDCVCELAELLYGANSASEQALEQGLIAPMTSYSNDGESASFDLSKSIWTEEGKARKTREIINRYLGNTGLLYRGV